MERTDIQLQWRTLQRAKFDFLATTCPVTQNPHLGGWRVAENEIDAARPALGWFATKHVE